VGGELILETMFLVDLEREKSRGHENRAHRFLETHAEDALYLTFTVTGELAAGLREHSRSGWEDFIRPFYVLPCTAEVCWQYGRVYRHLRDVGLLIGANDLWIGATALAFDLPLVTANLEHYRRVPDLRVIEY